MFRFIFRFDCRFYTPQLREKFDFISAAEINVTNTNYTDLQWYVE